MQIHVIGDLSLETPSKGKLGSYTILQNPDTTTTEVGSILSGGTELGRESIECV